MNTIKVSYRDIAKLFVKTMPVDEDEFSGKVEDYIEIIRALPAPARIALKSAYIFSHKVPREEREDLYQELVLAVLKAQTGDERLAYAVCRCDWINWWARFKVRQHYSLDSVVEDDEGNQVPLSELIIGEAEFELKMDGELDAKRIWDRLPETIKHIVQKRLVQQALTSTERSTLHRWVKREGYQLVLA